MDIDRAALMQAFLSESEEELGNIEQAVLALEEHPEDLGPVAAIFRTAHTLKGNAATLSLEAFSEVAHAMEDVLEALRSRRATVTPDLTSMLLRGVDALRAMMASLRSGRGEERATHQPLIEELATWAAAAAEDAAFAPTDTPPPSEPAPMPEGQWEPVLRVGVAKLDQLLGLATRVSVVQGQIGALLFARADSHPELRELHHKSERLMMELQDWVMDARMVSVATFFRPHSRTVRDAARSQRKRARLRIEGQHVRIDTGIGDGVRDALTHLVRNAVDHGIEPPAVRIAAGKSPEGTITLRAFPNGNQVVIQVSDDGGGLNLGKIRSRARALGRTEVDNLPAESLHRIIFEPGFSTAEQVSDLSGRGVGMDVVLRKVEALHGTVEIESSEGLGTMIELHLPMTLSVIEGFWVEAAGIDYVLPLDDVVECVDLPADRSGRPEREGIIDLRGEPLAFYRVRQLFNAAGKPPAGEQVVVVQHQRGPVGLAVDAIQGQRQTVIKPLGRLFRAVAGISGSALRPDGRVALVIDVPRLLRSALRYAEPDRTVITGENSAYT
jgi:two-component system chemotaxis sensor kinase CheA